MTPTRGDIQWWKLKKHTKNTQVNLVLLINQTITGDWNNY